jgi:biotin carboxyl carrier protein
MPRYTVTVAGQAKTVELEEKDGVVRAVIDGRERVVEVRGKSGGGSGRYHWLEGTRVVTADVDGQNGKDAAKLTVAIAGHSLAVEVTEARLDTAVAGGREARAAGPVSLRAPMPGRVVKLLVKAGDAVKVGQGVLVVEAMKMENELKSPRDGVVKQIHAAEGAAVEAGEDLARIE